MDAVTRSLLSFSRRYHNEAAGGDSARKSAAMQVFYNTVFTRFRVSQKAILAFAKETEAKGLLSLAHDLFGTAMVCPPGEEADEFRQAHGGFFRLAPALIRDYAKENHISEAYFDHVDSAGFLRTRSYFEHCTLLSQVPIENTRTPALKAHRDQALSKALEEIEKISSAYVLPFVCRIEPLVQIDGQERLADFWDKLAPIHFHDSNRGIPHRLSWMMACLNACLPEEGKDLPPLSDELQKRVAASWSNVVEDFMQKDKYSALALVLFSVEAAAENIHLAPLYNAKIDILAADPPPGVEINIKHEEEPIAPDVLLPQIANENIKPKG